MADSGVAFSALQTDYIAQLNTLVTFTETWATEVETARQGEATLTAKIDALETATSTVSAEVTAARQGEASLSAKIDALEVVDATKVAKAGLDADLPAAGYGITGARDATAATGYVTLQQANSILLGGGSPGDIPITSLGVGSLSNFDLVIRSGSAVAGLTLATGEIPYRTASGVDGFLLSEGGLMTIRSNVPTALNASQVRYLFG